VKVSWSATATSTFTVQVLRTSKGGGRWRTLRAGTTRRSLKFRAVEGATYEFRVRAIGTSGITGAWATTRTVVPSATRVPGARYRGRWQLTRLRDAWNGHALVGASGASLTLAYVGGTIAIIGDTSSHRGLLRVTLDGRSRTIGVRSARPHSRRVLFRVALPSRHHRLVIRVLAGSVPIEALAITNRTG
jgi:hypothetical protein